MSDIDALLAPAILASPEWRELESAVRAGRAPQTLIAIVPDAAADGVVREYARLVLCETHTGTDGCDVCRAWMDGTHPDMITAGPGGREPKVREPRSGAREIDEFQAALDLRPFIARGRIGVVPFAHKMSINASNALLKTAEEPPSGARLIFSASENKLLPTIQSRAWIFAPRSDAAIESRRPPSGAAEWAAWFAKGKADKGKKKIAAEDLRADIDAWAEHYAESGDVRRAADLKNLIYAAGRKHLSPAMTQDAAFLVLKEGVPIERLFGDLREA